MIPYTVCHLSLIRIWWTIKNNIPLVDNFSLLITFLLENYGCCGGEIHAWSLFHSFNFLLVTTCPENICMTWNCFTTNCRSIFNFSFFFFWILCILLYCYSLHSEPQHQMRFYALVSGPRGDVQVDNRATPKKSCC